MSRKAKRWIKALRGAKPIYQGVGACPPADMMWTYGLRSKIKGYVPSKRRKQTAAAGDAAPVR